MATPQEFRLRLEDLGYHRITEEQKEGAAIDVIALFQRDRRARAHGGSWTTGRARAGRPRTSIKGVEDGWQRAAWCAL
ncbi:hypothetical protein WMF31_08700 [Sorangium sp. So ce1036]|uniref:hypothetical protein n=1 Tax=Sorangium sp. So ce1036 TaxID=3133328 RepID=UPI003EFCC5F8